MTTTTFTGPAVTDHEQVRRAIVPTGVVCFLVAVGLSIQGADSTSEWVVEVVIEAVAAALLFGLAIPRGLRHESAGGRGIVFAVLGLLIVFPAFWIGLPLLFGATATLLGYAGKRAAHGSGRATASLLLGLLCVVAYLSIYIGDYMHVHGLG